MYSITRDAFFGAFFLDFLDFLDFRAFRGRDGGEF
jgi:hypothetical protein